MIEINVWYRNVVTLFMSNVFVVCSIDATDSRRLGRFVNDSPKKFSNCIPKSFIINGKPHVLLFSNQKIEAGTELRYNYGGDLPWRKVWIKIFGCSGIVAILS